MKTVTPPEAPLWRELAQFLGAIDSANRDAISEDSAPFVVARAIKTVTHHRDEIRERCEWELDQMVRSTTTTCPMEPSRLVLHGILLDSFFWPYVMAIVNAKSYVAARRFKLPDFNELAGEVLRKLLHRFDRFPGAPDQTRTCDTIKRTSGRKRRQKQKRKHKSATQSKVCQNCRRAARYVVTRVLRRDSAIARDIDTADKLDGFIHTSVQNQACTLWKMKRRVFKAKIMLFEDGIAEEARVSGLGSKRENMPPDEMAIFNEGVRRIEEEVKRKQAKRKALKGKKARLL